MEPNFEIGQIIQEIKSGKCGLITLIYDEYYYLPNIDGNGTSFHLPFSNQSDWKVIGYSEVPEESSKIKSKVYGIHLFSYYIRQGQIEPDLTLGDSYTQDLTKEQFEVIDKLLKSYAKTSKG
jgi:hypothetical protein